MTTNKERADWFKKLYKIYETEFNENSEVGEVCMSELDFYNKLMELVEDDSWRWD